MSIFTDTHALAVEAQKQRAVLQGVEYNLSQVYAELAAFNRNFSLLLKQVTRIADSFAPHPDDLKIVFEENEAMAKTKCTTVKMSAGKGMRADMPDQRWSALSTSGGLAFQLVDDQGNDMPAPAAGSVTTTLSLDDTSKVQVTKNDELSYTLTKAANVSGEVNLSATLNFNAGSPGPFSSKLKIILDVPAAGDLKIIFTPA